MADVRKSKSPTMSAEAAAPSPLLSSRDTQLLFVGAGVILTLSLGYGLYQLRDKRRKNGAHPNTDGLNRHAGMNSNFIFTKMKLNLIQEYIILQKELKARMEHERNLIGPIEIDE